MVNEAGEIQQGLDCKGHWDCGFFFIFTETWELLAGSLMLQFLSCIPLFTVLTYTEVSYSWAETLPVSSRPFFSYSQANTWVRTNETTMRSQGPSQSLCRNYWVSSGLPFRGIKEKNNGHFAQPPSLAFYRCDLFTSFYICCLTAV